MMQNTETTQSGLRGSVVLLSAAAMTLIIFSWAQPLYMLRDEARHASLDQTLFTTHVYTPTHEWRRPIAEHYRAHSLVNMFRVAQFASVSALAFAVLSLVMSAFQSSTYVTANRFRERSLCVMPVVMLMSLAAVGEFVALMLLEAIYRRHWHAAAPSPASAASSCLLSSSDATCDVFDDGCVTSFKDMGFVKREGFTLMWVALGCTAATLLCEVALWLTALRDSEPAATLLLQPENDEDGADAVAAVGVAGGNNNNNNNNTAQAAHETQPLL